MHYNLHCVYADALGLPGHSSASQDVRTPSPESGSESPEMGNVTDMTVAREQGLSLSLCELGYLRLCMAAMLLN